MDDIMTNKDAPVDNTITEPRPKNKKGVPDKETRIIYVIVATLLPLLLLSTTYFVVTLNQLSDRLTEMSDYVGTIEVRTVSLENRQTEFHGQLIQLDGKLTALSNSPVMKEVETLAPRVTLLEKQLASIQVRQKVTPVRTIPSKLKRNNITRFKKRTISFGSQKNMDCQ
jgi:hypothetical protein